MAVPSPRWGPAAFYDRRRTREFHKYYEPIRPLIPDGPSWIDLHDDDAVANHHPVPSPDKALTAFCQLAAIKLDVQRAMIFFFDAERGYVLAEATKSLSLSKDDTDKGDDLWLGHTTIPKGFTVCEHTVNLPMNTGSNSLLGSSDTVHVVNDLTGDVRFCNRPYVTDGPRARFYAGVPITTPAGINIGALCALDDKPRDGVEDAEVALLVDLAAAIMSHLEALRAKAEYQKGNNMLTGLTEFLDATSNTRNEDGPAKSLPVRPSTPATNTETHHDAGRAFDSPESGSKPAVDVQRRTAVNGISGKQAAKAESDDDSPTGSKAPEQSANRVIRLAVSTLLRVMDVDGVVIYDAALPGYSTANEDEDQTQAVAYPPSSGTNTAAEETDVTPGVKRVKHSNLTDDDPCSVLAASYSSRDSRQHAPVGPFMTRRLLKSLIRRHDHGKIWHFAQDDDTSDAPSTSSSTHPTDAENVGRAGTKAWRGRKADYAALLRRLTPEANCTMFLPIWNHGTGKWYAGAIVYTCSPLRSFSADLELRFMRAFCDVIIAELGRLDARSVARAKSTFVSSISHELRTPLHGILGSVEYLNDLSLDSTTEKFVSQIETCGQTMLDIVNHVLDFSHIDQIAQRRPASSDDSHDAHLRVRPVKSQNSVRLHSRMDLDKVSEDVIDSAICSFCSNRPEQAQDRAKVTTILDIDRDVSTDWTCRLSIGAWKRVCINLVINALKYTAQGYIHITLKQERNVENDGQATAILTIADTGRGMSKEFMKTSLFLPFEQEDGLSDGTGLGMSFVAKIIKAIGGEINVRSLQAVGTTVTVSVPLTQTGRRKRLQRQESNVTHDAEGGAMFTLDFVGNSWTESFGQYGKGRQILQTSITKSVNQILAQLPPSASSETNLRFNLIAEEDLGWLLAMAQDRVSSSESDRSTQQLSRPLIIACKDNQSMRRNKHMVEDVRQSLNVHVEILLEPCGTFQVAKALLACLRITDPHVELPSAFSPLESTIDQPRRPRLSKRRSSSNSYRLGTSRQQVQDDTAQAFLPQPILVESNKLVETNSLGHDALTVTVSTPDELIRSESMDSRPSIHGPGSLPTPALTPIPESVSTDALVSIAPTIPPQEIRSSTNSDLSLLLVDDNEINMRLLVMYANKQKHHHSVATDGLQAVQLYKAAVSVAVMDSVSPSWPQVILMDISMPVMDGFEATRRIRSIERKTGSVRRTYIIAMTGLGSDTAQREAMNCGMDMFLTKPVRLKELTKILNSKPWIR